MAADPFASSTFTLVLSWIVATPILCGFVAYLWSVFQKHRGVPWIYSTWVGLCFLALSPIRYIFFMVAIGSSYPFQSGFAFLTLLSLRTIFITLAFSILFVVGVSGPMFIVGLIAGLKAPPTKSRYAVSALSAPVLAIVGSLLFTLILPIAAILTTRGLRAEDVIGATNGPAYYVFGCTSPFLVSLPPYASETPSTTRDLMRQHVAWLYLSDDENKRFVEASYPELRTGQVASAE